MAHKLLNNQERKERIANMTPEQLLGLWRYAPVGSPWFDLSLGDAAEYLEKRLKQIRQQMTDAEWQALSDSVGKNGNVWKDPK